MLFSPSVKLIKLIRLTFESQYVCCRLAFSEAIGQLQIRVCSLDEGEAADVYVSHVTRRSLTFGVSSKVGSV